MALYQSMLLLSSMPRAFFSAFTAAIAALRSVVNVGPLSAVSLKNGRMLTCFLAAESHRMVLMSVLGCAPPL